MIHITQYYYRYIKLFTLNTTIDASNRLKINIINRYIKLFKLNTTNRYIKLFKLNTTNRYIKLFKLNTTIDTSNCLN